MSEMRSIEPSSGASRSLFAVLVLTAVAIACSRVGEPEVGPPLVSEAGEKPERDADAPPVDAPAPVVDPVRVRIAAGNLSSGNNQSYDPGHGIRIFKALNA